MNKKESLIPEEIVTSKILFIRGKKVLLDTDLAELYGVSTKRLNEQVKRNIKRFPEDFMFELTVEEKGEVVAICDHLKKLKFSSVLPHAFTEHGAVMLASVLNSDRAIEMNLQIVRIFMKLRELVFTQKDMLLKFEEMEKKLAGQDEKICQVFEYLRQFIKEQDKPRVEIGFKSKK